MIRSLQEEDPVFCAHNYSAVHQESPEKIVDLSCVDTNRSCNSPIFRHFCNHAFFCGRKRTWAFGSRLLAVSSQPSTVFIKTSWRISINPNGVGGGGGVLGISSDGDDRTEQKVKTQKNP